jgi:hypothetical protein
MTQAPARDQMPGQNLKNFLEDVMNNDQALP